MDKITPKKRLFILPQSINCPTKYPKATMVIIWVNAVMEAVPPTFISFLKLNSSPKLNKRNITPISAQTFTLFMSFTVGKKSNSLPAKNPATKYPKTHGCFKILKMSTAMAAVTKIRPKSLIKLGK